MSTAGDIVKNAARGVIHVAPDATVLDALAYMDSQSVGAVVVLEGGELAGIFSERDYARKIALKGRSSASTKVSEVMVKNVITIDAGATLTECMEAMNTYGIRHLPVFEAGRLLGVISIGEVIRHVIEEQRRLIDQLESYIHG